MDEYISRGDVLDITFQYCPDDDGSCSKADVDLREMLDEIEALPAADVQPVKHGYWYHNTSKYISELDACFIQACCSCCGRYSDKMDLYSEIMSNETCSHCGARMDLKDGDKE